MPSPTRLAVSARPWIALVPLLIVAGCGGSGVPEADRPLLVAAASSLQDALPEIAERFTEETGRAVSLSFGSSGQLATQVEQGAPFDLFLSADRAFVDRLVESGAIATGTARDYARGQLVLVRRADAEGPLDGLDDLTRAEVRAVAIAEPETAPYGRAARQALEDAGLWDGLQPKLVRGRSVRQALRYVETGDADAALVAESIAGSSGLPSLPIDPSRYEPIVQRLGVIAGSPRADAARDFADFLIAGPGRAVLGEHGFLPPAEADAPAADE